MNDCASYCRYNFENPYESLKIIDRLHEICGHMAKVELEKLHLSVSFMFDNPCRNSASPECDKDENSDYIRIIATCNHSPDLYARIVDVTLESSEENSISFPKSKGTGSDCSISKRITVRPKFCGANTNPTHVQTNVKFISDKVGPPARSSVLVRCNGSREGIIKRTIKGQDSLNVVSGALSPNGAKTETRSKRIFFSYAWDPEKKEFLQGTQQDESLEIPVKSVYDLLSQYKELDLLYDKTNIGPGDYLTRFMEHTTHGEVDLMIVFSSSKYWRSWYCMAEFCGMVERFQKTNQNERSSIIIVEHPSGKIREANDLNPICNYWGDSKREGEFPTCFNDQPFSSELMREKYKNVLHHNVARISSNLNGATYQWSEDKVEDFKNWIQNTVFEKLELARSRN